MPLNPYIEKLYSRQLTEHWSSARMAAEIGISQPAWHYLISGQRQPGLDFIRKSMRRFPEYDATALAFLRSDPRLGVGVARIKPRQATPAGVPS